MVELLVGLAVGLFIVVGATKLFADYLVDSRRLLVETRINQDLRAAADIVARDLRRSSYWQNALAGVAYPAASNPFRLVTPVGSASAATVTYSFDNPSTPGAPQLGFRLNGNVVEMQLGGGNWQALTDPRTVQVTQFSIQPVHREVPIGSYCTPACTASSPGCPSVVVRQFQIVLRGNAPSPNTQVVRELNESVRLRNDEITGACP